MSIRTSIPSDLRRPGSYVEFDVVSGARGLTPITRRIALIGARLSSPAWITLTAYVVGDWVVANGNLYRATVAGNSGATAPSHTTGTAVDGTVTWVYVSGAPQVASGTPHQMFSDVDGEYNFGRGSELALMVRAAFKAGKMWGSQPEIWAIALDDPGGGARATRTLTVTGPATAAGDVQLKIVGRTVRVGVASGDTATTIAANIKSAIDRQLADLPYSPSAAAGVVTLRANNAGVNGTDATALVEKVPPGVAIVVAVGVAGAGAYDITATLDVLVDKTYHAVVIANHTATDVTDLKAYITARNSPAEKAFTMAYLAETGTLTTATTLATGSNRMEIHVITAEAFPNLPGELAAMVATVVEASRPGYNHDGTEIPAYPPPVVSVPTSTEIEAALAAGATPLTINATEDGARIVRMVTTKTTENGAPFEQVLDSSNVRALFYTATQVDIRNLRILSKDAKRDADTRKLVKSNSFETLLKIQEQRIIHHVEDHKDELLVEEDDVVTTRFNVAVPTSVIPDLHQLAVKHILLLE